MTTPKESVTAALARAKAELDQALADLEALPAFDPGVVGFAAHALNNYLAVAEGTLDLLGGALQGHPDEQVNILRAQVALGRSDHAGAEKILAGVTRREPKNVQAWVWVTKASADPRTYFTGLVHIGQLERSGK